MMGGPWGWGGWGPGWGLGWGGGWGMMGPWGWGGGFGGFGYPSVTYSAGKVAILNFEVIILLIFSFYNNDIFKRSANCYN